MGISEALRQLREDFQSGMDRIGETYFHSDAIQRIADGDRRIIGQMLEALDAATPGGNFHVWLDCGEAVISGDQVGFVYGERQRKPSEIAAVLGKALVRAKTQEAA